MTEEEKEIKDASVEEVSKEKKEDEMTEEFEEETEEEKKDKKIKNLISAIILLAGLFVGSLFVDVMQMVRGGGFSQRALNSTDVFASNGKTWVAYDEPLVKVQVITDDTCEACKPDEVLVGLKSVLPTMLNEKIDANSEQGKKLISSLGIKALPAFVFSKEVEKTELFAKAEPFLDKKGESFVIKSAEAGFPVGKFVEAPKVSENDIKLGSSDESALKIFVFSDFQNPLDKAAFQAITNPMISEYGDRAQIVFKGYTSPASAQGVSAALAVTCANEQGKFLAYADKLFGGQTVWAKVKDATPIMKGYAATLGLKTQEFNKCLDDKKYQDLLTQTLSEGQSFGIQSTPSFFVGTELKTGALKYDEIKSVIDGQLSK